MSCRRSLTFKQRNTQYASRTTLKLTDFKEIDQFELFKFFDFNVLE